MFAAQYAMKTWTGGLDKTRDGKLGLACCGNVSYHCVYRHLLRKTAKVPRHHGHCEREVGDEAHGEAEPRVAHPLLLGRDLADHTAADDGEGHVPDHPVGSSVAKVRAASSGEEDEKELGEV